MNQIFDFCFTLYSEFSPIFCLYLVQYIQELLKPARTLKNNIFQLPLTLLSGGLDKTSTNYLNQYHAEYVFVPHSSPKQHSSRNFQSGWKTV